MKRITMVVLMFAAPLLLILLASPCMALEPIRVIEGHVTKVVDGGTIHVRDLEGAIVKVRLYGIDAPETDKVSQKTGRVSRPGQPYGTEAFHALQDKIDTKRVKLEVMAVDRYRQLVSMVWIGSQNVNADMVAEGWAWAYRRYLDTSYASAFINLEEKARREHKGLWQQRNPQPPGEFRKLQKIRSY